MRGTSGPERKEIAEAPSIDRRAWVRYAANMEISCQDSGILRNAGWPGKVMDISVGGIGLILRHRFPPGAPLAVELKSPTGKTLKTISARVMHSRPVIVGGDPCWLIGCALVKNFAEQELQQLLAQNE
jgi:hypothetical protein